MPIILLPFLLMSATMPAIAPSAGQAPVKWTFAAVELPNGQVRIDMMATIETGWHVYATELPSDDGPIATSIIVAPGPQFTIVGTPTEPEPDKAYDPNFAMTVHHHSTKATFSQMIARRKPGSFTITGSVEYMACNDRMCLPPVTVPFSVDIAAVRTK